jgi:hypothetical protein
MPDFIHELIIMIIATLGVFAIVALRDRITIQRYYNTFQITPSIKLFYEWGYYVALDLAWLRWNVSITLYDRPFSYTEDELNEFEEWDATLEDGLDDETPLSELELETTTTDEPEVETTTDEPVVEEPFVDTTMPKAQFQGSHRVTLTMNGTETAPIIFTPEMLREIKQRENTMWGRNNNDNPDTTGKTNTTGNQTTNITDETDN